MLVVHSLLASFLHIHVNSHCRSFVSSTHKSRPECLRTGPLWQQRPNQRSLIIAWRGLLMAIACGTHGETRSGTKNKPATNARTMSFSPQRTRVETTHNIIDHARLIDDRHSRHFTLTPLALRTAPPNQRKGKVSSPWRPGGVPPRHVWCSRHAVSSSQSVICTGPQQ